MRGCLRNVLHLQVDLAQADVRIGLGWLKPNRLAVGWNRIGPLLQVAVRRAQVVKRRPRGAIDLHRPAQHLDGPGVVVQAVVDRPQVGPGGGPAGVQSGQAFEMFDRQFQFALQVGDGRQAVVRVRFEIIQVPGLLKQRPGFLQSALFELSPALRDQPFQLRFFRHGGAGGGWGKRGASLRETRQPVSILVFLWVDQAELELVFSGPGFFAKTPPRQGLPRGGVVAESAPRRSG